MSRVTVDLLLEASRRDEWINPVEFRLAVEILEQESKAAMRQAFAAGMDAFRNFGEYRMEDRFDEWDEGQKDR